jgi:glycosyltransferase involved in cell wall biosynthesis
MTTDAIYPRVLILGEEFDDYSGGGITLTNLFAGWPADRLATVSPLAHTPNWDICRHVYRLGSDEYPWRRPWRTIMPSTASGPVEQTSVTLDLPVRKPSPSPARRMMASTWQALQQIAGSDELFHEMQLSDRLDQWLRAYQPDVVYAQLGVISMVRLTELILERFNCALAIHLMDDWPTTKYAHGLWAASLRRAYDRGFRRLLERAQVRLGICPQMCEAYRDRYQYDFLPFHNPVDLDIWRAHARTRWTAGTPFRIRYGGRLGWAIRDSILQVCAAVDQLRREGHDIVFEIYSEQNSLIAEACTHYTGVTLHPMLPRAALPASLSEADVLLIAYDFSPLSIKQARYSMPTKVAECMASGTPILIYGPADVAVCQYARDAGWGVLVDKPDTELLIDTLHRLMTDEGWREQLGRAEMASSRQHDLHAVSQAFQALLHQSVIA